MLLFSAFSSPWPGSLLAVARNPLLIVAGRGPGHAQPNGQEAGPFSPLEQALLPDAVPSQSRTRGLRLVQRLFGFLPSALGALAGGGLAARGERRRGDDSSTSGCSGVLAGRRGLAAVYSRLLTPLRAAPGQRPSPGLAHGASTAARGSSCRVGAPGPRLAGGGASWSRPSSSLVPPPLRRWSRVLGPLFFGTSLLSAASFLVAARLADRFGLLQTAVFTHIPSNVLLMVVPMAPSFPVAAGLLLARHLLSQMDVPTRQAYTMALVDADERAATAGFTASARSLAAAVAPVFTGFALARAASACPSSSPAA